MFFLVHLMIESVLTHKTLTSGCMPSFVPGTTNVRRKVWFVRICRQVIRVSGRRRMSGLII